MISIVASIFPKLGFVLKGYNLALKLSRTESTATTRLRAIASFLKMVWPKFHTLHATSS